MAKRGSYQVSQYSSNKVIFMLKMSLKILGIAFHFLRGNLAHTLASWIFLIQCHSLSSGFQTVGKQLRLYHWQVMCTWKQTYQMYKYPIQQGFGYNSTFVPKTRDKYLDIPAMYCGFLQTRSYQYTKTDTHKKQQLQRIVLEGR